MLTSGNGHHVDCKTMSKSANDTKKKARTILLSGPTACLQSIVAQAERPLGVSAGWYDPVVSN